MRHVLSNPLKDSQSLAFAVLRVPFFLEPEYDEYKQYIESNRERLIKKWGGKKGWERQKRNHEYVYCFFRRYVRVYMNMRTRYDIFLTNFFFYHAV